VASDCVNSDPIANDGSVAGSDDGDAAEASSPSADPDEEEQSVVVELSRASKAMRDAQRRLSVAKKVAEAAQRRSRPTRTGVQSTYGNQSAEQAAAGLARALEAAAELASE